MCSREPPPSADPPQSDVRGSPLEDMLGLFGATSAAPADLDAINAGPFTPLSPNADEQDIGDFLVLVMGVRPDATQGVLTAETLTLAWDEI